jgi:hypothetical protein
VQRPHSVSERGKGSNEAQNGRVLATKSIFNYSVKAMACWLGFGFWNLKPGQSQLQANTFGLAWLGLYGLAWLGFWPEAKPCTSLPVKQVKTSGDWFIAWGNYTQAAVYVFPHRKEEFNAYATRILSLFAATSTNSHASVINLDKGI